MAQEDTFDTTAFVETENTGDLNRYAEPVPEGEMKIGRASCRERV